MLQSQSESSSGGCLLPCPFPIWNIAYLAIFKGSFSVPTAVLFKFHLQAKLESAFVLENIALKAARGATWKSSGFCDSGLNSRNALRVFVCFRHNWLLHVCPLKIENTELSVVQNKQTNKLIKTQGFHYR